MLKVLFGTRKRKAVWSVLVTFAICSTAAFAVWLATGDGHFGTKGGTAAAPTFTASYAPTTGDAHYAYPTGTFIGSIYATLTNPNPVDEQIPTAASVANAVGAGPGLWSISYATSGACDHTNPNAVPGSNGSWFAIDPAQIRSYLFSKYGTGGSPGKLTPNQVVQVEIPNAVSLPLDAPSDCQGVSVTINGTGAISNWTTPAS